MNNRFMNLVSGTQFRKVAAAGLAIMISFSSTISVSAQGVPTVKNTQLKQAQVRAQQTRRAPQQQARKTPRQGCPDLSRDELLLVMPNASGDKDEMKKAFEDVHGTIIGSIGKGDLKVYVVKSEKGKLLETEKKLSKDTKNFRAVNINRTIKSAYVPTDPRVGKAWHLPKLNVYNAFDVVKKASPPYGYYNAIAILDSGCSWQGDTGIHNWGADVTGVHRDIHEKLTDELDGFLGTGLFGDDVEDLDNEIEHWGNYAHTLSMGVYDNNGHGTWVASAAAGNENGKGSVGVCPGVQVVPIKIADGPFNTQISTDDISLVSAMVCALESKARIVNISYSGMNDVDSHEVLHELFKHFYYKKNGLIYVSAGNDGERMSYKDVPYINTISAITQVSPTAIAKGASPLKLVNMADNGWDSNTGACVDFCAPGADIPVTNPDGTNNTVDGTSFSAPIVAGIAALMLRVNPKLTNRQVETIMVNSCSGVSGRNAQFGFGLPDAEKCVKAALRG